MAPKAIWELRYLIHEDRGIWLSKEAVVQLMQDMEMVFAGKYEGDPENS